MKLVKIEDVRVGQVWQLHNLVGIVLEISNAPYDFMKIVTFQLYPIDSGIETECVPNVIEKHKLIGFIGITHEIKDNKLVEIQRENLEVDDVVKDNFNHFSHVINQEIFDHSINKSWPDEKCFEAINETYGSRDFAAFELKKIGIYGVTHEFVNERLIK